MTLTKAIEAARNSIRDLLLMLPNERCKDHNFVKAQQALAALPDKPMTEDEIKEIILRNLYLGEYGIFRALKAADCLYVKES